MTDQSSESDSEREAIENAAREQRMAQYRRDEIVAWAMNRAEELRMAEHNATKRGAQSAPPEPQRAVRAPDSLTRDWQSYIDARIKQQIERHDQHLMHGIAVVVIDEERRAMQEAAGLRERVGALESELAELRDRINGQRGLRSVPTTPASLIA